MRWDGWACWGAHPQQHGGQGADALTAGIAVEEVARADLNACYLVFLPALVEEVLVGAADERQRERWLPAIAAGEALQCFCLIEPEHVSDAARLALRAERDGTGWRLTGEKTSISLGMSARTALCSWPHGISSSASSRRKVVVYHPLRAR